MRETGAQDGKLFLAFLQPLQLLLAPQSFRMAYGQPAVLLELPRLPERLGPTADPQEPGRLPCNRPQRRTLLLVRLILSSVALAVCCSGHSATSQADAHPALVFLCICVVIIAARWHPLQSRPGDHEGHLQLPAPWKIWRGVKGEGCDHSYCFPYAACSWLFGGVGLLTSDRDGSGPEEMKDQIQAFLAQGPWKT